MKNLKFEEMNIEEKIVEALSIHGLEEPTQIQKECIPLIQQGFDVVGQSKTGSGKTAAFGVPLIEAIDEHSNKLQALILSPTRELAQQIAGELVKFSKFKRLHVSCVYGGVSINPQIKELRHANIVVGTPGRTLDHIRRKTLDLRDIKIFVLDEVDRMLDMGFIEDIETVIHALPPGKEQQMLFFGATMTHEIREIAKRLTKDEFKFVQCETLLSDALLEQLYYEVSFRRKFSLLVHLLKNESRGKVIIFCNTRREVDLIAKNLKRFFKQVGALHGGRTQAQRNRVIGKFHAGKFQVLVATDVAGRGLDINDVSHIINYDIPQNPEDYINRIGRTARAGNSGKAISILTQSGHDALRRVMNNYPQLADKIRRMDLPNFKRLPFVKDNGHRHKHKHKGNRKNRRPRKKEEYQVYSSYCQ